MIRIILDPLGEAQSHEFIEDLVVLAPEAGEGVDLIIGAELAEPWRVEVRREENGYCISSTVESADISLDGTPFSEEVLAEVAELKIGDHLLQLEHELGVGDEESESELVTQAEGRSIPIHELDIDAELAKIEEVFSSNEATGANEVGGDVQVLSDEQIERLMDEAASFELFEEATEEPVAEPEPVEESSAAEPEPEETDQQEQEKPAEESGQVGLSDQDLTDLEILLREDPIEEDLSAQIEEAESVARPVGSEPDPDEAQPQTELKEEEAFDQALLMRSADWRDLEIRESTPSIEAGASGAEAFSTPGAAESQALPEDTEALSSVKPPISSNTYYVLALVAVLFVGLGILGYRQSLTSKRLERMAVIAVSDLAMALVDARGRVNVGAERDLLHTDFLSEHMNGVIGTPFVAEAPLLAHRSELLAAYDFDVARTEDLSHFMIWAHPKPSWLGWFSPEKQFLLFSDSMRLRQVRDPQVWQDFFANGLDLSEADPRELGTAEDAEIPIMLKGLDAAYLSHGFSTPRQLSDHGSAAMNRIHNAPRYYPLGSSIMEVLADPSLVLNRQQLRTAIEAALERFSALPHFVAYSAAGREAAESLREVLNENWADHRFLLGFVEFNASGTGLTEVAVLSAVDESEEELWKERGEAETPLASDQSEVTTEDIDRTHPLYVSLLEMSTRRKEALEEVSGQLIELMTAHNERETEAFHQQHASLMLRYNEVSRRNRERIARVLESLWRESEQSEGDQGVNFLKANARAARLDEFLPDRVTKSVQSANRAPTPTENRAFASSASLDELWSAIQDSQDLERLHRAVYAVAERLDREDDALQTEELSAHYNTLRSLVLNRIETFILSPDQERSPELFQSDNRDLLSDVLTLAKVNQREEREFFLHEFDSLVRRYHGLSHGRSRQLMEQREKTMRAMELAKDHNYVDYEQLTQQKQEIESELKSHREQVQELKTRITQVPMDVTSTEMRTQQRGSARLGQQILLQAAAEPASRTRDERLMEAIGLLGMGTEENRALWQDILEARRLLVQTPEEVLQESLQSDLGLIADVEALPRRLRKMWHDYVTEMNRLDLIEDPQQRSAQYRLFEEEASPLLKQIIELSGALEKRATFAGAAMQAYLDRLTAYLDDYQAAKSDGFFQEHRAYHQRRLSRLAAKIQRVTQVVDDFTTACQDLSRFAGQTVTLANQELNYLETESNQNLRRGSELRDTLSRATSIDPLPTRTVDSMRRAMAIEVHPIPK